MRCTLFLCVGLALASAAAFGQAVPASGQKSRESKTSAAQPSVQKLFAAGKTAFARGDLATAKSLFQAVRARVPGHPSTDFYLAQIQLAEKENRGVSLEQRLAAIEVSSLTLEDVTLEEAVEVVRKQVEELDNPALPANFVLLVPPEARKTRFSLSLTGVPLTALLEYIASLTGAEVAYEKHAVVFREPGSGEGEDEERDAPVPEPKEP